MYCRNCGNKLEEEDLFCPECGRRIKIKKEPLIDYKNLEKKYQKQLIGLAVLLTVILVHNFLNNTFFSEEAIIKKYVKSYANKDYMNIIELSDMKKNRFITNKNIQKKYGDSTHNKVDIKILTTNKNKKEHTRTVSYKTDDYSNIINLKIKRKGHKYLIFNNYVITSANLVAENVRITIPKDSKLIVDHVELSNQDKVSEKKLTTTYKIDSILKKDVTISVKLKNGITITDIKSVFNNEEIDYTKLNYTEIDKKNTQKITSDIKKSIQDIVTNAVEEKEFNTIRESNIYTERLKSDVLFEENYHKLKEKYKNKSVTEFETTKVKINNIKLDKDKNITLNVTIQYKYKDKESKLRETTRRINITLNHNLLIDELYLNNLFYLF